MGFLKSLSKKSPKQQRKMKNHAKKLTPRNNPSDSKITTAKTYPNMQEEFTRRKTRGQGVQGSALNTHKNSDYKPEHQI